MSGSADKIARRDLRRAVGASAIAIVDKSSHAIAHLVEVSNRSVGRLDALERETLQASAFMAFTSKTFWQRVRWVLLGR